jgi:hypothetical protein
MNPLLGARQRESKTQMRVPLRTLRYAVIPLIAVVGLSGHRADAQQPAKAQDAPITVRYTDIRKAAGIVPIDEIIAVKEGAGIVPHPFPKVPRR